MKFDIKNRFTSKVIFTADIEANEDDSRSKKLGLAVKAAYKSEADLRGADLWGADLLIVQNIGSEAGTLIAAWKDDDCQVTRGCFKGSLTEFKEAVIKKHSGTRYYDEYMAVIQLIELRMKKEAAKEKAA